jgi:hypothetical protein
MMISTSHTNPQINTVAFVNLSNTLSTDGLWTHTQFVAYKEGSWYIVLASISFSITITASVATMAGIREGSDDLSADSISIDDSVVVRVFQLVPINFSQHPCPNAPQFARNHRLLEIRAIATALMITVFAFATRRAVRV